MKDSSIINITVIVIMALTAIMKLVIGPDFAWFGMKDSVSRCLFFVGLVSLLIASTILMEEDKDVKNSE